MRGSAAASCRFKGDIDWVLNLSFFRSFHSNVVTKLDLDQWGIVSVFWFSGEGLSLYWYEKFALEIEVLFGGPGDVGGLC